MIAVVGAEHSAYQIPIQTINMNCRTMLCADHSVHPPPQHLLDGCPLLDTFTDLWDRWDLLHLLCSNKVKVHADKVKEKFVKS